MRLPGRPPHNKGLSSNRRTPASHTGNEGAIPSKSILRPIPVSSGQFLPGFEWQATAHINRACCRVGSAPGRNPGALVARGFDSSHAHQFSRPWPRSEAPLCQGG